MIKTLLKKQMLEVFKGMFFNAKTGEARELKSTVIRIVLFGFLMFGVVGGSLASIAGAICPPLIAAHVEWLYFIIYGAFAILLGLFGSAFSTFNALYNAKDNDLLLSMPIPPSYLMCSRLLSVFLLAVLYSLCIILPAAIIYFIYAPFTVAALFGCIALELFIVLIDFVLACLLGYVIAKISRFLKNKNVATLIVSLVFIALYYGFTTSINPLINYLVKNAAQVGTTLKTSARILYMFGTMGTGNVTSMLVFNAAALALLCLTVWFLSKSFLKLATTTNTVSVKKYVSKAAKQKSVLSALFGKEAKRFTGSALYMLSCGMGLLFIAAIAVFALIKGDYINNLALVLLYNDKSAFAFFAAVILAFMTSTVDVAAPSVSLEGKSLWIYKSLPVSAKDIIKAKLYLQLLIAGVPTVIAMVCFGVAFKFSVINLLLFVVSVSAFMLLSASVQLLVGTQKANFAWTNEQVPIKQSMPVMVAFFGGWAVSALFAIVYILLRDYISGLAYFAAFCGIVTIAAVWCTALLFSKAPKMFEKL